MTMTPSSSPSPPHPMVPVPQALETVLIETSKLLWFDRQRSEEECSSTITTTLNNQQHLIGRISSRDIKAPQPGYPNHNASIMDGYAVKCSELKVAKLEYDAITEEEEEAREKYMLDFDIVGRVYAGDDEDDEDDDGNNINNDTSSHTNNRTAIYVTTGAVVPTGYDAVIPIEDTTTTTSSSSGMHSKMHIIPSKVTSILNTTKPLTWIRPIGCDIPSEHVVLAKGETIQPVHLALLAQVGVNLNQVPVKRLPRVGVLSTGNELVSTSTADDMQQQKKQSQSQQQYGKIPDVNRPLLLSQLSTYGNCVPIDLGIVTDDEGYENIAQRLNKLLWTNNEKEAEDTESIDVLITTGGISMGEKDIMERVFVTGMGGKVHFGRMNMKPGKPTTFITIDREDDTKLTGRQTLSRKLIFALPGNPVSASVCTELLVRPCLDLLHDGGVTVDELLSTEEKNLKQYEETFVEHAVDNARVHEEIMATITSDIKLDQGRPEYRRVTLQRVPVQTNNSGNQQYTYHATDTGVQRSSRVLSLRGADGLMMLPRGGPSGCGYDIAKKGMEFPALLYSSFSSSSHTTFKDSMHRAMLTKSKQSMKNKKPKLKLGVIICSSSEQVIDNDFQSIESTLISSLGGHDYALVLKREVCRVADDTSFARELSTIVSGSQMKGTNVIFVIVQTDPLAEENGGSAIAFKAGLEVSHALRPILTKKANAMAMQIRQHAALQDPLAALFENVVGTVRDNSTVLITCSDKGLNGAVGAVKGLLGHLVRLILITVTSYFYTAFNNHLSHHIICTILYRLH